MTDIASIAADAAIAAAYPGLAAAAAGLATPQIRNVATLGGNLAQRSRCWYYRNPHFACLKKGGAGCTARTGNHLWGVAFDLNPCIAPHPSTLGAALLAYDAAIDTTMRRVAVGPLLDGGPAGNADNGLAPGEIIKSVELLAPLAGERALYKRAISRTHAEWPLVEVVARAVVSDGRLDFVRVVAGGVAPTPLRLPRVETAAEGAPANFGDRRRGGRALRGRRDAACDRLQDRPPQGTSAGSPGSAGRLSIDVGESKPCLTRSIASCLRAPASASDA